MRFTWGYRRNFFNSKNVNYKIHYLSCTRSWLCFRVSPEETTIWILWHYTSFRVLPVPFKSVGRAFLILNNFWGDLPAVEPVLFGNRFAHCMELFVALWRGLKSHTSLISVPRRASFSALAPWVRSTWKVHIPTHSPLPTLPWDESIISFQTDGIRCSRINIESAHPLPFRVLLNVGEYGSGVVPPALLRHSFVHLLKLLHVYVLSLQRWNLSARQFLCRRSAATFSAARSIWHVIEKAGGTADLANSASLPPTWLGAQVELV